MQGVNSRNRSDWIILGLSIDLDLYERNMPANETARMSAQYGQLFCSMIFREFQTELFEWNIYEQVLYVVLSFAILYEQIQYFEI